MKFKLLVFFIVVFPILAIAQKQKADSILAILPSLKSDTQKVKALWELGNVMSGYNPDKALTYAHQALNLANEIKYPEGRSKALGVLAITFRKIGDYSSALNYNLKRLQLVEKENNPENLANVLMSIGVVYLYQEEYQKALFYYYKSDSVIKKFHLTDSEYYIYMNLGNVYDKLNNTDSAFIYFNKSLVVSSSLHNEDYIGNSMTGLGNTYLKMGNTDFARLNYSTAINHLLASNNDEVLCEAYIGMANLYQKTANNKDSAVYYAKLSLQLAQKDGFINWQLNAAKLLTELYKDERDIDSAFVYLSATQQLNDSVNSKERIRQVQVLSSNETLRQLEIEESKRIAQKERQQQLQYLLIAIFIPGFFLLTLLLSRIKIHSRIIKILGVLSLLILFEFLLLLLHPKVAELTNHTPIVEMLIFVALAALLIPGHHRFETWLIKKLTHKKGSISVKKAKLNMKKPAN